MHTGTTSAMGIYKLNLTEIPLLEIVLNQKDILLPKTFGR